MQTESLGRGMDSAKIGYFSGMRAKGTTGKEDGQPEIQSWILELADAEKNTEASEPTESPADSSMEIHSLKDGGQESKSAAERIYEAAFAGKPNPVENLRQPGKVPYGHLAVDGVIEYNGVVFVCDERTNSICMGDMSDEKNVLTIALSGGGCLKVNRDNIGDISKAVGMFSPEDLNLIMRAIAQDAKVQSMKQEIDDMENNIGNGTDGVENGAENETDSVENGAPGMESGIGSSADNMERSIGNNTNNRKNSSEE